MHYTLTLEQEISPESERILSEGLISYNTEQVGASNRRGFSIWVRDSQGTIFGGLTAVISWNWLFISRLWVSEELRGQGYGRDLLMAAEQEAVVQGCEHSYLDTFSFQARGFYEGLGYQVFGQLEDFPPGHTRYFLQKRDLKVRERK